MKTEKGWWVGERERERERESGGGGGYLTFVSIAMVVKTRQSNFLHMQRKKERQAERQQRNTKSKKRNERKERQTDRKKDRQRKKDKLRVVCSVSRPPSHIAPWPGPVCTTR